jgi:hypothetical protein
VTAISNVRLEIHDEGQRHDEMSTQVKTIRKRSLKLISVTFAEISMGSRLVICYIRFRTSLLSPVFLSDPTFCRMMRRGQR